MLDGVDIGQVLSEAVSRAGYGPHLVQPLWQAMGLQLLMMDGVTAERVTALAQNMLPDVAADYELKLDQLIAEQRRAFAEMPTSGTIH
jgi:hypothetical protein